MTRPAPGRRLHVLVLTDRDWLHPQGGGTGTNLYGQISRWVAWGHRVTVIAGDFDGAEPVQRLGDRLEIHHMGTRLTVFARAAQAVRRGLARDADVVLEVVNGIAFFTPLWWFLRAPRVALVHHVHQEHYVTELGLQGRVARLLLERLPLTVLYRSTPFLTISHAAAADLEALGVPGERIHVAHLGVDPLATPAEPVARDERPRLLYLGRLKAYKRVEVLLDVLEAVPDVHLDIAGEGDHRPALEAEIAARGLGDRVTLHGHVTEEEKARLYARAWVNVTASSAEGWCLTVMEAATCATPSAALRVGGLEEAVEDGRTGVLADTPEQLRDAIAGLVADPERVRALGEAARERAAGFTWEATAERNLGVLADSAETQPAGLADSVRGSETAKAAGMAMATLAANALAIVFTVVFTRLLGVTDYGALGALISTFTILAVAGSALQVAVARETALGRLGDAAAVGSTIRAWLWRIGAAGALLTTASIALREPLAEAVAVPEHAWAAAAILPTGVLWLLLSVLRGALQGLHAYAPVGASIVLEAGGRLVAGLALVAGGLGVTGAYLGTPLAMLLACVVLAALLRARTGDAPVDERPRSLAGLVAGGWAPIIGLVFLAVLQNVDVIVAKHQMTDAAAGAYAAAVVAAKLMVWVAIGIGLYLLPEATRRAAEGLDPRPVFFRTLAVLGAVALPALAIFAVAPALLLRLAFGEAYTEAAGALIVLGAAMTLLAVAYLTVQYMLALRQVSFLWVLGVVAVAEPFLLTAGDPGLLGFSAVVLGLQCVAACAVLALGLRVRPAAGAVATSS